MTNFIISISLTMACLFVGTLIYCVYTILLPCKLAKREHAFCDLLDYATLSINDTIVLKNGGLMQVFKIYPKSYDYATDNFIDEQHKLISSAFQKLGGNFVLNFDLVRHKIISSNNDVSYYGPNIAKELFKKREELFVESSSYNNEFFLSITYLPNKVDSYNIFNLFKRKEVIKPLDATKEILNNFDKTISAISSLLTNSIGIKRCTFQNKSILKTHESINFIKDCISFKHQELVFPNTNCYLDALLSEDFEPGLTPKIADKYISVVSIDGLPSESYFGILKQLNNLNFEYRFSTRYICFDPIKSNFHLEKYRRLWTQKRRGIISQFLNNNDTNVNIDAVEQIDDLRQAKKSLDQNSSSFGAYTASIIIMNSDLKLLEKQSLDTVSQIEKAGFNGRIETYNATDAYLGSLPGHTIENLRRNIISNQVLCDLIPINSPYLGERYSPNIMYGKDAPYLMAVKGFDNSKAYLNLHVQDLGNTLVVGPPGSGKSVFLGSLITSLLRYERMKVFVFDKGYSFYATTLAYEGEHTVLGISKSNVKLAPLSKIDTEDGFIKALNFIYLLYKNAGFNLSDDKKEILKDSLRVLLKNSKTRTISEFINVLTDLELKPVLRNIIKDGKSILDGDTQPDISKQLTVFECENFFSKDNDELYPTLHCLFNLLDEAIEEKNIPCAIVIDEAWLLLSNEDFSKKLIELLKTVRKHNVLIIMATQSLSDFYKSKTFFDVIDCVKTRVYFPNYDAKSEVIKPIYEQMGLNEKQLTLITEGVSKKDLFLQKQDTFMPFNLVLSEDELKLLSKTQKDKQTVDELYKEYKNNFVWSL